MTIDFEDRLDGDGDGDGDGQDLADETFCIYGCTDYHLADCPSRDRGATADWYEDDPNW